jgi:hypothetical protein
MVSYELLERRVVTMGRELFTEYQNLSDDEKNARFEMIITSPETKDDLNFSLLMATVIYGERGVDVFREIIPHKARREEFRRMVEAEDILPLDCIRDDFIGDRPHLSLV